MLLFSLLSSWCVLAFLLFLNSDLYDMPVFWRPMLVQCYNWIQHWSQQRNPAEAFRQEQKITVIMSLLEDLVHLLRYVLEYFGVPQDMVSEVNKSFWIISRFVASVNELSSSVICWKLYLLICSWFQFGRALCVDSIAVSSAWSGPISPWHLILGSVSRYSDV